MIGPVRRLVCLKFEEVVNRRQNILSYCLVTISKQQKVNNKPNMKAQTSPKCILALLLASAIHPSSAGLWKSTFGTDNEQDDESTRALSTPTCDKSVYTDGSVVLNDMVMEDTKTSPHFDCGGFANGISDNSYCNFIGDADDHLTLTQSCDSNGNRIVYMNYDYSVECGTSRFMTGTKVPMCVPSQCEGQDWVQAFTDYVEDANPYLSPGNCTINVAETTL